MLSLPSLRPLVRTALSAAALSAVLSACGPSDSQKADAEVLEADSALARDVAAVERIVYAMPSAPQVIALLRQAGAKYDARFLNPDANQARYTASDQAALNIGVYSTDLAVASAFNQSQESVKYFVAVQKLADRLGIASAFDETVISRLDRNRTNQDSVTAIVTRSFMMADRKLRQLGQEDVARLILVGGWVEGLHLATEFYAANPKNTIAQRIAEQKLVLDNLLEMIAADSARANFKRVYQPLKDLKTAFAPVAIEYTFSGVSTDPQRKLTRIDNRSEVKISPDQLAAIRRQVATLRNAIIQ